VEWVLSADDRLHPQIIVTTIKAVKVTFDPAKRKTTLPTAGWISPTSEGFSKGITPKSKMTGETMVSNAIAAGYLDGRIGVIA
jgi:hypothetical protein